MKKTLCLVLTLVMALSLNSVAFATNTNNGTIGDTTISNAAQTQVEYIAETEEQWTLTVPAKLAPGQSGNVTVTGNWSPETLVTVALPETTITMSANIAAADRELGVSLNGGFIFDVAGSVTEDIEETTEVTVEGWAEGEAPLFGTWTGKIVYDVAFNEA